YADSKTSLSLPSTRVDAFNVTLAEELSRNGRKSGLTFAPEGGSERLRRVINKMVSEEDVLQIARMAKEVIRAGREASGHRDIRCTVSIGGFVPKPHTPFQWAAQLDHETTDRRLQLLKDAIN